VNQPRLTILQKVICSVKEALVRKDLLLITSDYIMLGLDIHATTSQ